MILKKRNKKSKATGRNSRNPAKLNSTGNSRSSNRTYYRPTRPIDAGKKPSVLSQGQPKSKHSLLAIKKIPDDRAGKSMRAKTAGVGNLVIVVIFATLLFFATTMSSKPVIKLREPEIVYRPSIEYIEAATEIQNNSIFNKSKFLFDSVSFEKEMIARFPEIEKVSAVVPLGGRDLDVHVVVSEPFAILQNGSASGIVNEAGVLVTDSLAASSSDTSAHSSMLKVQLAVAQDDFQAGSRVFTTNEVQLLKRVHQEFTAISDASNGLAISVDSILFSVSNGQLEIRLNEYDFIVRMSTYADDEQQVGGAVATMKELLGVEDNPVVKMPSSYIDVRVPGRVFVL